MPMLPLHVSWYLPLPTHSNKLVLTTQKLMRNPTKKLTTHTLPYPKTGGVTSYVDLYQDHPSMIFCLFMTAGHLSHSTLVADQDFLTAEEKNVAYSSRNFSVRSKTLRRNSCFFSSFLGRRGRRTDALKSLSLLSLSLLLCN